MPIRFPSKFSLQRRTKKTIKVFIVIALIVVCCLSLQRIYYVKNDRFNVSKMRSQWDFNSFPIASLEADEQKKIADILDQPFSYLGKGMQVFVFESQDHQYVLKFFKQKQFEKKRSWLLYMPIPTALRSKYEEKNASRKEKLGAIFQSYLLAYQEMPKETGVVYLHLDKGQKFNKPILLIDRMRFQHKVDMSRCEFVLQKKGFPLSQYLHEIKNDPVKIEITMGMLLAALEKRCNKGILDLDKDVVLNMAVTPDGGDIFFVDAGFFKKSDKHISKEETKAELCERLNVLKEWAEKSCPELIPFITIAQNKI